MDQTYVIYEFKKGFLDPWNRWTPFSSRARKFIGRAEARQHAREYFTGLDIDKIIRTLCSFPKDYIEV